MIRNLKAEWSAATRELTPADIQELLRLRSTQFVMPSQIQASITRLPVVLSKRPFGMIAAHAHRVSK